MLTLRTERYGDKDYRRPDARVALDDLELFSKLDAKKRAALAKIDDTAATADRLYYTESKNEPALVAGRTAWEGRKTLLGPDQRKSLSSENLVANCLYSLNHYDESEPLYLHVLAVREKAWAKSIPTPPAPTAIWPAITTNASSMSRRPPTTARR